MLGWFEAVFGPLVLLPFGLLVFVASAFGVVQLLDRLGVSGPRRRICALFPTRSGRPTGSKRKELATWQLGLSNVFGLVLGVLLLWYGTAPLLNRVLPRTTIQGRVDAVRESGYGRHHRMWIVVDGVSWKYSSIDPIPLEAGDRVRIELEYFHDGRVARVWRCP